MTKGLSSWVIPGILTVEKCTKKMSVASVAQVILETIAKHNGVTLERVQFKDPTFATNKGKGKGIGTTEAITSTRHLYCYMMKLRYGTEVSLKTIGNYIYDGFDHTSVMHGVKRVKDRLITKELTSKDILLLTRLIDKQIIALCLSEYQGTPAVEKTQLVKPSGTELQEASITSEASLLSVTKSDTQRVGGKSKSLQIL